MEAPAGRAPVTVPASGGSRVFPSPWLAPLVALVLPLHVLFGSYAWSWLALLFLAWMVERRTLLAARPGCARSLPARLSLGEPESVAITLDNAAAFPVWLRVRDDLPPALSADKQELSAAVPAGGRARVTYEIRPGRRGRHRFGELHVTLRRRFGLCEGLFTYPLVDDVHVYPNTRTNRRYSLAAQLGHLRSLGIYSQRRPGAGGEFEHLREYVTGDPYRDIDWKATAKRLRPVLRVHGEERSQTVLVAVDVGRMMATALTDLTKLDHALQASLLLTHVALRAGDRVGLVLFADDVRAYVPPMRGPSQYRRVLAALHDVEASPTYVDFRRFSEFVLGRMSRRCLIVIFSDLLDESQAGPIGREVGRLRRRHLPVCVTMEDPVPRELSRVAPGSEKEAFARAAAADLLVEREAIKVRLGKAGIGLLEAPAGELAIASVNRYLDIKRRRAL